MHDIQHRHPQRKRSNSQKVTIKRKRTFTMMTRRFGLLATTLLATSVNAGIYPSGHFDHVTLIDEATILEDQIDTSLAEGKTLFIRWIASEG